MSNSPSSPIVIPPSRFDGRESREALSNLQILLRLDKQDSRRVREQKKEPEAAKKEYLYALRSAAIAPKMRRYRPGLLRVDLVSGKNLKASDAAYLGGPLVSSDPFCKMYIISRNTKDPLCSENLFSTASVSSAVIPKQLSPKWNESFRFKIYYTENNEIILNIDVYDESTTLGIVKHTPLGEVRINVKEVLNGVENGKVVEKEFDVMCDGNKEGSIKLKLSHFDLFAVDARLMEEENLIQELKSGEGMRRDTLQRMSIMASGNDPRFSRGSFAPSGAGNRMSVLPGSMGATGLSQQQQLGLAGNRMSVLPGSGISPLAGNRMSVLPQPASPRNNNNAAPQGSPPKNM